MTGRRRVDMIDEMEEGRHRGAVGYQSDYGSRLSNLFREISKMDVTDQEFLRTLLRVGGGGQTPAGSRTEQLSHIPRPGDPGFLQTPRTLYDHDSASGWDTERQTSVPRHERSGVQQTRARTYYSPETPAPPRGPTRPSVSGLGGSDFSQTRARSHYTPETPAHFPIPTQPHYAAPVPPKLAAFSGEGNKNEPSYAQWRSEVDSIWRTGIYQEALILTNLRRSVRGRAADVLLAMGTEVSVEEVLRKFDVRFGDVCPTDMTLEQFFTARQMPTESMSAWGCRLEDMLGRIKDSSSAASARHMLRSRFWSGIYSDRIRNALRHHFDEGSDFEALIRHARVAEQEPSRTASQQAVSNPGSDKLDMILKQLTDLTSRVKELEKKMQSDHVTYGPEAPAQATTVGYESHSVDTTSYTTRPTQAKQFAGQCFACGQIGHKRGSPYCPKSSAGNE